MFRIERREKKRAEKMAFLIKPIFPQRRRRTKQSRAVSLKWYTWNIFHNLWKMAKLSKIYLGGCPWKSEDGNSLGWLCAVNGLWEPPNLTWNKSRLQLRHVYSTAAHPTSRMTAFVFCSAKYNGFPGNSRNMVLPALQGRRRRIMHHQIHICYIAMSTKFNLLPTGSVWQHQTTT